MGRAQLAELSNVQAVRGEAGHHREDVKEGEVLAVPAIVEEELKNVELLDEVVKDDLHDFKGLFSSTWIGVGQCSKRRQHFRSKDDLCGLRGEAGRAEGEGRKSGEAKNGDSEVRRLMKDVVRVEAEVVHAEEESVEACEWEDWGEFPP